MRNTPILLLAATLLALGATPGDAVRAARAEPAVLRVLTTTTDLREIAKEVGGDAVEVTCLMKGPEDPHFLEARPSFVRAAANADLLVVTGMELETGYEPLLLADSRNAKIQKGKPGYVDCSAGVSPLEVPEGPVDRSHGDVHAAGNPHYLLDPVRGKVAAATIAEHLALADPARADAFRARLDAFRRKVDVAMFGEEILGSQPAERLERKLREGTLAAFVAERGVASKLGGFAKSLAPHAGKKVAVYHRSFTYLLDRFHLGQAATVEPKPGVAPSPKHLAGVVAAMRRDGVRALLHLTCHPAATAQSVATQSGASAVLIAHQPDAVEGTGTYLGFLKYDVDAIAAALAERPDDGAADGAAK